MLRGRFCASVLFFIVLASLCTAAIAQDATLPARPAPGTEPTTVTAPPPNQQVKPLPQVPVPRTTVPSPISPSVPVGPPVLPPAEVPEKVGNYVDVYADLVHTTLELGQPVLTVATGNVTARFRDFVVTAARAQIDYKTNIAAFEGNVVFHIGIQEARGDRLEVDLNSLAWSFTSAKTTITPEFAQGYLNAPIFATAERVTGVRDRQLAIYNSTVTTCNLPNEHYDLSARSVVVYPNDKIVFRKASIFVAGNKIITIPRFVVPLREITRNPNTVPRIGETADEGYYLKYAYPYMGNRTQMGFLLLDLMSRKGIGHGIQHYYKAGNTGFGSIYLYRLEDRTLNQTTFNGRFNHTQQLGAINFNASSNFRSNSYFYAPQSQTIDNRLTFTRARPGASTSLILGQTLNDVITRSENLTGNLSHRQAFGPRAYLNANFDYTGFTTQDQTRARLVSQALYSKQEEKFDWNISAQKQTDLSDEAFVGQGQFGGIDKLPELAITTDTARLGNILPFGVPARMQLSYGRFAEVPSPEQDRVYFDINSLNNRYTLSNTWGGVAGAGFKQFVYGDNTAQYSINADAQLTKKLDPTSTFALTYRYQRPRGFTPFRFDFIGRYNIVNASLNIQENERFRLSLLTGYNFEQPQFPWQDSVLRFTIQPSPSFLLYTATGFDFNRWQWQTLINQIRIRAGDAFRLDLGTRFDPTSGKLATVRTVIDTPLGSKMRAQAIAGYNGLTGGFDYRGLMITRDLHCWEASLTYVDQGGFWENRGIYFNLRIKAFPLFQSFGMGNFGQALDTSVGQVY